MIRMILFLFAIQLISFSCKESQFKAGEDAIFESNYSNFNIGDTLKICMMVTDVNGYRTTAYAHSYPNSLNYNSIRKDSIFFLGELISKELGSSDSNIATWKKDVIYNLKLLQIIGNIDEPYSVGDIFPLLLFDYARPIMPND